MALAVQPLTSTKPRGRRRRKVAEFLIKTHRSNVTPCPSTSRPSSSSIRVVCVSDTHNTQPVLPMGDVLIHAGDLTLNGSFEEMQTGLTWLSSQPHKHKIFIGGNHDILLDETFSRKYPDRGCGGSMTKQDLEWGNVIYLQDTTTTLDFPILKQEEGLLSNEEDERHVSKRSLTIFGSPRTPQFGVWAFQYQPINSRLWKDVFSSLERKPDIIVTHGPPYLHQDTAGSRRAGCPHLGKEIHRIKPRVHLFGHIHASYGRKDVSLDGVQRSYEDVMVGSGGWGCIILMTIMVVWSKIGRIFGRPGLDRLTSFINASAVGGPENELQNEPIVIDL